MKRAYIGLAVYVLAAALSQGAAQRTFKAYPVFPARAPAMVEVIQEMIGSEGKVIYDGSASQLLVSATPEAHSKIVAILEEVNVPVRNVRIDVLISEHTRNSSSALGLDGSGDIVVRPHGSSAEVTLSPKFDARTATMNSDVRQTLVVQSGSEGTLRIGEDVPFEEWLIEFGRRYGYIEKHIVFEHVGSYLRMQPRIVGDGPYISILLTPELSGLVNGRRRRIRFAGVATQLTVRDGDTFTLGGVERHRDFYDRFLIGTSRSGQDQHVEIKATPHIVGLGGE